MQTGRTNRQTKSFDLSLIFFALTLTFCGLLVIFSATRSAGDNRKLIVQSIAACLGFVLMYSVSRIDFYIYKRHVNLIYIACLLVLASVLLFGVGKEQTGANSWIRFFGIGIQPSELIKVAFSIIMGEKLAKVKKEGTLNRPKIVLQNLALYLGITVPVVLQNDTGTALVFTLMFFAMYFVAGISLSYVLWAGLGSLVLLPAAWLLMAPYQKNRILVFLNPTLDPSGAGYQVLQSKRAIGSGTLLGRGYQKGPLNQLSFLPEKDTDFIFSTIGEEFGFIGCIIVVTLLFLLIFRIFYISKNTKDSAGSLICTGIGTMFFFHTAENICMCLGLLPVTGIPLPFLSYGGSSLVTNFLAIGLIFSIQKHTKELQFYESDY